MPLTRTQRKHDGIVCRIIGLAFYDSIARHLHIAAAVAQFADRIGGAKAGHNGDFPVHGQFVWNDGSRGFFFGNPVSVGSRAGEVDGPAFGYTGELLGEDWVAEGEVTLRLFEILGLCHDLAGDFSKNLDCFATAGLPHVEQIDDAGVLGGVGWKIAAEGDAVSSLVVAFPFPIDVAGASFAGYVHVGGI